MLSPELTGKRLELLKQVAPRISRVAVLGTVTSPVTTDLLFKEAAVPAQALDLELKLVKATGPDDLDRAFSAMAAWPADAVFVLHDPMLRANSRRLGELASKAGLPAMADISEFANRGGLMAYGATLSDRFHRAATYIDKVLKGAKPANLPVEQPTRFELVINLKTANALGLSLSPSLLLLADEVIQ
jgi:putative ABC transport system substrate-binding protein